MISETKDRAEKVRIVAKMKDKIQSGADSIQFFINTMHEIREQINLISRSAMEEELRKMNTMREEELRQMRVLNEQTNQEVVTIRRLLQSFIANNAINGNDDSNARSIDFTET